MTGERLFSRSGESVDVSPEIDHGRAIVTLGVLAFLVMAYSLLVIQQILFGVLIVLAMGVVYMFFVLLQLLDRIAAALETIAERDRRD